MTGDPVTTDVRQLFDCSGRVAVVTGAAGKLGPVWAHTLLDAGATVAMLTEPGRPASPELAVLAAHPRAMTVEADVTRRADLDRARYLIQEAYGGVDILVANAGRDHPATPGVSVALDDLRAADLDHILGTNVVGTLLSVSVFGGGMVAMGRGSIVLVGSQYALVSPRPVLYEHLGDAEPFVKNPAYGASKAGVVNLARYFAAHWGPAGVRVNVLSPGGVHSDQDPIFVGKFRREVPLGRMAEPADLRGPLLFLASDASSFVTGAHLVVDGGYSVW